MRLITPVLPWDWNCPQPLWAVNSSASWDSFPCAPCGLVQLMPQVFGSCFLTTSPPWYQGLLSAPPEPLLPAWASPFLNLSSWSNWHSHDHHAFDTLENGSIPGGECILFCKETGKVNYTDTLHSLIWFPVSREPQSCVQAQLCYRQGYTKSVSTSCLCRSIHPSHPFSGRSVIRIAYLYPAPPFQEEFPFFSEQFIKPVLTISIHTNGRKTSALPLYCGRKSRWSA